MQYDGIGNVRASTNEVLELLYSGKDISGVIVDEAEFELFDSIATRFGYEKRVNQSPVDKFDTKYNIPLKYKSIDLVDYFSSKIETEKESIRVAEELFLFNKYGLEDTLRLLIYVVDQLRSNDIVWGVGRGSSVASYCLYLIGVHRINSLKYDLDIKEFLKDG